MEPILEILIKALHGMAAGFVSALVGYFRHTPVPEFDAKKFIKTLIIGAIVGAVAPWYPEDLVLNFLTEFGYVTVIDRIVDLIYARIKGTIGWIKSK